MEGLARLGGNATGFALTLEDVCEKGGIQGCSTFEAYTLVVVNPPASTS
jgi:hypothetical protein